MKYKDDTGKVLYGFSQENLEKTNQKIHQTNKYLQILIVLFLIFLVLFGAFIAWLEVNNVFTKLIYGV